MKKSLGGRHLCDAMTHLLKFGIPHAAVAEACGNLGQVIWRMLWARAPRNAPAVPETARPAKNAPAMLAKTVAGSVSVPPMTFVTRTLPAMPAKPAKTLITNQLHHGGSPGPLGPGGNLRGSFPQNPARNASPPITRPPFGL